MAQNITLMGAQYSDVPGVLLPRTGGGQALFSDSSCTTAIESDVASGKTFLLADGTPAVGTNSGGGGSVWTWMGENPEQLQPPYARRIPLSETKYATWTPSTTSYTIIPAFDVEGSVSLDISNYDYWVCYSIRTKFVYDNDVILSKSPIVCTKTMAICISRFPTDASLLDRDYKTTMKHMLGDVTDYFMLDYYDITKNRKSYTGKTGTTQYGVSFMLATSDVTLSDTSLDTPSLSFKIPAVNVKCHNTYFTTTSAGKVDQSRTFVELAINMWRVNANTSAWGGAMKFAVDLLDNQLLTSV